MPKQQGGNPLVWNDIPMGGWASGQGSAAPSRADLSGSGATAVRCEVYTPGTEDRKYLDTQILHGLYIPASGNCSFHPHVHCTFVSEPAADATVIWELSYVYAKGSTVLANAGVFAASPAIITGTYTVPSAPVPTHTRAHLIIPINSAAVDIPVAECGPSMLFESTVRLKSTSTIGNGIVALLSIDWHYRLGPLGTDGEYS